MNWPRQYQPLGKRDSLTTQNQQNIMKARIYILEGNALGLPSGGETYNSLKEALANLPIGYKIARYGYDSHVIVKASHDFEAERYGEIGYVYTGSAA